MRREPVPTRRKRTLVELDRAAHSTGDDPTALPVQSRGARHHAHRATFRRTAAGDGVVGPISRLGWEAIEYYCWGAFGATAAETSAYHGLNFFAAEFGDVLVYPGGNAFIAKRLTERLARDNAPALRSRVWVLRIEKVDGGFAVTTWEDGTLHRYAARSVIFAAPLFLAPTLIPALSDDQKAAIGTLRYRSYVVANVLLRRSTAAIFRHAAFRASYEMTRVHGVDVKTRPTPEWSAAKVYSDAILADYPVGRGSTHAVMTVYRPYPYEGGRSELTEAAYGDLERDVRREVVAGFGPHGLRTTDIEGIELCRWGHPMLVARPGQMADGTIATATRGQPGLYLAHTDVMGAPAYENAIAAAHDAVDTVRAFLRGRPDLPVAWPRRAGRAQPANLDPRGRRPRDGPSEQRERDARTARG